VTAGVDCDLFCIEPPRAVDGGEVMKTSGMAKAMALALGLLLATGAFAANKGSMKLFDNATVGGTQLKAGEYSVVWEGNGPRVEVQIMKGHEVVATTTATIVDLKKTPNSDATTTKANGAAGAVLTEIFFHGKTQSLSLDHAGSVAVEANK
jgi:hypothetical protein